MKRFLTTTALALSLGSAALAADDTAANWSADFEPQAGQFYGSDLIGMRIYRAERDYDNWSEVDAGAEAEWDDIGEINDLIISKDGELDAVILGIGGFLGIGERDVAIQMDNIRVLHEKGDSDDRFLVVNATAEQLGEVPAYEREVRADMGNMTTADGADATSADAADMAAQDGTDEMVPPMWTRPNMQREGYAEVEMVTAQSMSVDELQGAYVYDVNEENIGDISELIVEDGTLTTAVIDVGGFLGMGEKPVAVKFDSLQILKSADGGDMRVYVDATKEQLEAAPEHNEG